MYTQQNCKIEDNLETLRKTCCHKHSLSLYEYICTNSACITKSPACFLCKTCYNEHKLLHPNNETYLDFRVVFSMNKFEEVTEFKDLVADTLKHANQAYEQQIEKFLTSILDTVTKKLQEFKSKSPLGSDYFSMDGSLEIIEGQFDNELQKLFESGEEVSVLNPSTRTFLEFYIKFEKEFYEEREKKSSQAIENK